MTLPTALRLNALLSLTIGSLLAVAPGTVGAWLEVSVDGWLRLLGITLLGHAALLVWASEQPSINAWAKVNLAAIAPYPLIMVALVATGLVDAPLGRVLLLLDGAIVGVIAFAQWTGLRAGAGEAHPVPA